MSSSEIEDVLSSIRRLVSEDLRPSQARNAASGPVSVPPAPDKAVADAPSDKLILTPALRVIEDSPACETALDPQAEDVGEAPVALDVEQDEPEQHSAQVIEGSTFGALLDRIAQAAPETQFDDDGDNEAEAIEGWAVGPEVVSIDVDAVEEAEVLRSISPDEARLQQAWHDGAWAEAVVASLHEPEMADSARDEAPLDPELADLAEAAALAEIARAQAEAEQTGTEPHQTAEGLFDLPEDGFDEEALRDLVRDIIREELQGVLGERITRNVRKLVRSEINRILVSREMGQG